MPIPAKYTALDTRIPASLVTGFLGSGKTTLINAVLRNPAFANALVIVNEFGEVGLDHLLMEGGDDQVVLLDSGCLCCAVSGSLRDTLIDLFMRRAGGDLPPFERVIIETSGLANPVPLVASLVADSAVARHYRLALVLTVVDALHGMDTLASHDEAVRQVAVADRLLISKVEAAGSQATAELQAHLAAANMTADIVLGRRAEDAASFFADLPPGQVRRADAATGPVTGLTRGPFASGDTHGPAFSGIRSQVLRVPGATDWPAYAAWAAEVQRRFGKRLLRCKGLLRIGDGNGEPWVIQAVQGHFTAPVKLGVAAAEALNEKECDFLVCIGERIDANELQSTLGLLVAGAREDAVAAGAAAMPLITLMECQ
jgi:G3E family GTPase